MEEFPRVAALSVPPTPRVLLLFHPDLIQEALVPKARHYDKKTHGYTQLSLISGQGLITSDGELWRRQRRMAAPHFRPAALTGYLETMTRVAVETADEWAARPDPREPVDLFREVSRVTLRIAGLTLFSTDLTREAHEVGLGLTDVFDLIARRVYQPLSPPLWLPLPSHRRFRAGRDKLRGLVARLIEERRAAGGEGPADLLSALMGSRDEDTGEAMSDELLVDEAVTMLGAGYESTATAVSWSCSLLARHPELQERARAEAVAALGGRAAGAGDLEALPYTTAVFSEAMRLYPPLWAFSRRAVEPHEVGGYAVAPPDELFLSPWATHRHPEFWPDPERFDPERFLGDAAQGRHRFAWIPFGGGPRACIGKDFAMAEGVILLATWLGRYRLEECEGSHAEIEPSITLRPRGGLPLRLMPVG
jgi:cytochrome P450